MRYVIGPVVGVLFLGGCAGIDSKSLDSKTDADDRGFRYYETSPFLLVFADGKGSLESKLLYLPDSTKKRSIRPYNYGAKNDATLKFDQGRLVQAKAVVDETIIPGAVIQAMEKVALANITAANGGKDGIPAPVLYRILGDDQGGWKLVTDQNSRSIVIKFVP
jgi:hypothetical protein